MLKRRFFDSNCNLGASLNPRLCQAKDVNALYEVMDHSGVEKALVRYLNVDVGAVYGNEQLARMLKDDYDHRLYGMWNILPESCNELPKGEAFFDAMKENRIAAVRILPGFERWVPARISIGSVMDALRERRIPTFIHRTAFTDDWNGLYNFLELFPDNIYILGPGLGSLWGTERQLRPIMDTYKNVYLEISNIWMPEAVGDFARDYGAKHILYGSGYPDYTQGSMMAVVQHLEIDEADKDLIASGNLERIISEEVL